MRRKSIRKRTYRQRKHRIMATISVVAVAAVILLSGTMAWQSISQKALNETRLLVNPGGRLHDDFNGTNKDVYVENFTDSNNGGQPLLIRVRLDEYLEFGEDAGTNLESGTRNVIKAAGTDINDKSTWLTHKPNTDGVANCNSTIPALEDPSSSVENFHDFWKWTMGGSTVFMPTFNKNKDSLTADINGTYAGSDGNPATYGDRYGDYVTYAAGDTKQANAIYDADTNSVEEDSPEEGTNIKTVRETHTAKATQTTLGVMTMAQWKEAGSPQGKYWVYDTDGWAYWAELLQPGEATGLLLDKIELIKIINDSCYYAINVIGQFVTPEDMGKEENTGFYNTSEGEPPSADAERLLKKAAGLALTADSVTVSGANGATSAAAGSTLNMNAVATKGGSTTNVEQVFTWELAGDYATGTAINSTTGALTIGAGETSGTEITVKATTADGISGTGTITVAYAPDSLTVTAPSDTVGLGGTLQFSAEAKKDGNAAIADQRVNWSLSGNAEAGTTLENGLLTVSGEEAAGTTLTITATSVSNGSATDSKTVTVTAPPDAVTVTAAGNKTEVAKGRTLQFSATVTSGGVSTGVDQTVTWSIVESGLGATTSISSTGLLTVDAAETAGTLHITATTANSITSTPYEVTVTTVSLSTVGEAIEAITPGSTSTVTLADGKEYYVLAKNGTEALLWITDSIYATTGKGYRWNSDNAARNALNGTYYNNLPEAMKSKIIAKDITTRTDGTESWDGTYDTSHDYIFLLSEADLYGTISQTATSDSRDYTYGNTQLVTNNDLRCYTIGEYNYLRNPYYGAAVIFCRDGSHGGIDTTDYWYSWRPAFWYDMT